MRPKNKYKQQFEKLQDEFSQTKDVNILNQMYIVLIEFYKSMITSYAKNHHLFFNQFELEEKATDCAGFTISHYLVKEGFYIKNLTGYGWFDMIHELFKDKDEDKNVSLEVLKESYDDEELPIIQENRENTI